VRFATSRQAVGGPTEKPRMANSNQRFDSRRTAAIRSTVSENTGKSLALQPKMKATEKWPRPVTPKHPGFCLRTAADFFSVDALLFAGHHGTTEPHTQKAVAYQKVTIKSQLRRSRWYRPVYRIEGTPNTQ
jgi:hypothetical protein